MFSKDHRLSCSKFAVELCLFVIGRPGGLLFTSTPTVNRPHMTPFHYRHYSPHGLAVLLTQVFPLACEQLRGAQLSLANSASHGMAPRPVSRSWRPGSGETQGPAPMHTVLNCDSSERYITHCLKHILYDARYLDSLFELQGMNWPSFVEGHVTPKGAEPADPSVAVKNDPDRPVQVQKQRRRRGALLALLLQPPLYLRWVVINRLTCTQI